MVLWQPRSCVHSNGELPHDGVGSEEVENMPPQNMPLWHIAHSEHLRKSRCRKNSLTSLFLPQSKS